MNKSYAKYILEKLAQDVLKNTPAKKKFALGMKPRKADIFLLKDREMKALKRRFLPTRRGQANVLSFSGPENWPELKDQTEKIGEIYLNWDLNKSDLGVLRHLLIHGILHLLGYEHRRKNDRIEMENLEKKLELT